MKKSYRLAGLVFIALAVVVTAALAWFFVFPGQMSPSGGPPLRLAVDIWPGNFWIIVANEKGYFKEENLPVELFDVSADYNYFVDEFAKGKFDADILALFDLVDFVGKGNDFVGILSTDMSMKGEGIAAKPELADLSDLRGKRVGVTKGTYLDYYLDLAMTNKGLSANDYVKVDVNTDLLADEFDSKNLDAAMAWEPTLGDIIKKYGLKRIFSTSDIGGSPGILTVPRSLVESRPDDVNRLLRAWEKATEFIKTYPKETMDIISRFDFKTSPGKPFSAEEIEALMEADPPTDLQGNLMAFSFSMGAGSLYGGAQNIVRYLQKYGKISPDFDVSRLFDTRFIRFLE